MKILFIGNYQTGPGGEMADEVHLTRELESQGHVVYRTGRDEWREYVIEGQPKNKYHTVFEDVKPDIVIICKWHHFYDGSFIEVAKAKYGCPVFYWVWDWMNGEEWHIAMAKAADLYLSGELGSATYYHQLGIKFYYFQFDSCDGKDLPMAFDNKEYEVVFLGSHTNQNNRLDILREINREVKIKVFAYDWEEWQKDGFDASPAVYGQRFNEIVAKSKIVLGTSANVNCFGYWSNRVGKVLYAGGFLLQWYTPGMENTLGDCCEYFNTSQEAIEKIRYYLDNDKARQEFWSRNILLGRIRWTSEYKVRQLGIIMDRYLKSEKGALWILP